MIVRHAVMDDANDLLRWRNDPVTQANFRSTAPVSAAEHEQWMLRHVRYGGVEHVVLIGLSDDGRKVGVVRFDGSSDAMTYNASITIAPEFRGQGCGRDLLQVGCLCMSDYTIRAEIKTDNTASRRAFAACGFEHSGVGPSGFEIYRRAAQ